jgi:hypothetical protein
LHRELFDPFGVVLARTDSIPAGALYGATAGYLL